MVRIVDSEVWRGGELLGRGQSARRGRDRGRRWRPRARRSAPSSSGSRRNTLEYIGKEAQVSFEPLTLPPLHTKFEGRHALVVVRGHDYRHDLAALRPYIREYHPVLIGVDGGADALLELGLKPDIIIGDFDSVSERRLPAAPDLVHHVHPDGRAPGRENLVEWGVDYEEFVAEGTSEDVAMLLAYEAGVAADRRRSARTPRWSSSSTRVARAWRRRSSPGCASVRCSSTRRA